MERTEEIVMALSDSDTQRMFPRTLRFDSDDEHEIGDKLTQQFDSYKADYEIIKKEKLDVTKFFHYTCRRIRDVTRGNSNA